MAKPDVSISRMHLRTSDRRNAESFAREVSRGLHGALSATGASGHLGSVHVSMTAQEAGNAQAVVQAIARAVREAGE